MYSPGLTFFKYFVSNCIGLCSNPTNDTARSAVISFANELAALFSPIVGCTRSWANQPSDSPGTFKVR